MAITSYVELKDAIASWLGRVGDTQITSNAADFITMAESYINRNLRVRQMETVLDFTTVSGVRNLPDDYLAWRRMTWLGTPYVSLEYLNPDVFNRFFPEVAAGIPTHFTIEGYSIKVRPIDDVTTHEFLYYAKPAALVDDADTNWLLTGWPDLYLAASLVEANAFLLNTEHAALWAEKRDGIIDQMIKSSEKSKGPAAIIPIGNFY